MLAPWKKRYDKPRQHTKKQRHYFANKGPSSQSYGFSGSHVQMWELDHKEGWAPKNWCFWTVMLENILESPLDCKEIKPVNPKSQSWIFSLEGLTLKLNLQYFGRLMWRADSLEKTLLLRNVDLQCCVSFRCIASDSDTHTHTHIYVLSSKVQHGNYS